MCEHCDHELRIKDFSVRHVLWITPNQPIQRDTISGVIKSSDIPGIAKKAPMALSASSGNFGCVTRLGCVTTA
jgi:hypothetical protein